MNDNLAAKIEAFDSDDVYVLVCWPWVQDLMEHPWFREECILYQAFDDQEHLDSAYFVPIERITELSKPG